MLINIVFIIVVLLGLLLIYAATKPSTFRITREILIAAPVADVFAHGNSLQRMQVWSPWKKLDPAATFTFSGLETGVGGQLDWSGNKHIGAGRQVLIESVPDRLVRSKVEFFRPFAGESEAEFIVENVDGQTKVTWGLSGANNFLSKIMCVFMDQDKMLGGPLSEGLLSLKRLVETGKAD